MKKRRIWAAGCLIAILLAGWWLSTEQGRELRSYFSRQPGFRDVTAASGITFHMDFLPDEQGENFKINLYDHGSGIAVADYDGDGKDDIYFVNQLGRNALYRNNGDGTFTDVTDEAGVGVGDRICVAATFADYDNDGHQDLFITSTRGGNLLFRNLGNGKFQDVTKAAGVGDVGHSQLGMFFDYDNDGYLDLFVVNTASWTTEFFDPVKKYWVGQNLAATSPVEFNILYRNNRDGTFTDVTAKSGLKGRGWAGDATIFDYNDDGHMDVVITSMFGRAQLYRNDGKGGFSDVTLDVLGATPYGGTGVRVLDFNNDGKLDLFIVDMHSDMWMGLDYNHHSLEQAKLGEKKRYRYLGGPKYENDSQPPAEDRDMMTKNGIRPQDVVFGNALYKNLGGGKFVEISQKANMEQLWPWGIATGDFDNDGYEDTFIPCGMGFPFYYWPNHLMMNNGNETFTDRAADFGIEPPAGGRFQRKRIGGKRAPRSSRSAATADFEGKGRLDIVVNNFNDQPYFFRNQFPQNNYVAFRLRGKASNRDAIGAVAKLFIGKEVMTRQVDPASGYLAQSSRTLHFGLGARDRVDRLEIRWPSGRRQTIDLPAINVLHDIIEPSAN